MTTMNWTFIKPAREACSLEPYAITDTFGDGTLLHWQCVEHPEYRIQGFWGDCGGVPEFVFLAGVGPEESVNWVDHIAGVRVRSLASCLTLQAAQRVCENHLKRHTETR